MAGLGPARPISNALPGIPQVAEHLGKWVTRHPLPYLIVVILIAVGLAYASTDLKSEFSIQDILPRGGGVAAGHENPGGRRRRLDGGRNHTAESPSLPRVGPF